MIKLQFTSPITIALLVAINLSASLFGSNISVINTFIDLENKFAVKQDIAHLMRDIRDINSTKMAVLAIFNSSSTFDYNLELLKNFIGTSTTADKNLSDANIKAEIVDSYERESVQLFVFVSNLPSTNSLTINIPSLLNLKEHDLLQTTIGLTLKIDFMGLSFNFWILNLGNFKSTPSNPQYFLKDVYNHINPKSPENFVFIMGDFNPEILNTNVTSFPSETTLKRPRFSTHQYPTTSLKWNRFYSKNSHKIWNELDKLPQPTDVFVIWSKFYELVSPDIFHFESFKDFSELPLTTPPSFANYPDIPYRKVNLRLLREILSSKKHYPIYRHRILFKNKKFTYDTYYTSTQKEWYRYCTTQTKCKENFEGIVRGISISLEIDNIGLLENRSINAWKMFQRINFENKKIFFDIKFSENFLRKIRNDPSIYFLQSSLLFSNINEDNLVEFPNNDGKFLVRIYANPQNFKSYWQENIKNPKFKLNLLKENCEQETRKILVLKLNFTLDFHDELLLGYDLENIKRIGRAIFYETEEGINNIIEGIQVSIRKNNRS